MPNPCLVGDHSGAENYATFPLAWAAESGVDYGSPITFINKGNVGKVAPSGTTPNGYIIDNDGVDYDGTNIADMPIFEGLSVTAANGTIRNFKLIEAVGYATSVLDISANDVLVEKFRCVPSLSVSSSQYAFYLYNNNTNRIIRNFELDGRNIGASELIRTGYNRSYNLFNYIIFGGVTTSNGNTGTQGFTDGLAFDFSGDDYGTQLELTNAASEDATGSVGLTGYTSVELVDFAGGDYRTKSTSDLATAGTGGSFIGAFLESGGGTTYDLGTDGGTFSYAGATIATLLNRVVETIGANYSYTGSSIGLLLDRSIDTVGVSYSYTGGNLSALFDRRIQTQGASYNYSGSALDLVYSQLTNYQLDVDGVSYTYTGGQIQLLFDRSVDIGGGSFSYDGANITLIYTEIGGYSLDIDGAVYSYSGGDVVGLYNRLLELTGGAYTYTGGELTNLYDRAISTDGGNYNYIGGDIDALYGRSLPITGANYDYDGGVVGLVYSGAVTLLIDGYSVQFKQDDFSIKYQDDIASINYGSVQ